MTRDELIEHLKSLPEDISFIVVKDEEGNGYRFAHVSNVQIFCDQDGEIVCCHPDDIAAGEYEGWEDEMFKAVEFW